MSRVCARNQLCQCDSFWNARAGIKCYETQSSVTRLVVPTESPRFDSKELNYSIWPHYLIAPKNYAYEFMGIVDVENGFKFVGLRSRKSPVKTCGVLELSSDLVEVVATRATVGIFDSTNPFSILL